MSTMNMKTLAEVIAHKKNIVFYTGAGLSAGTGVPTFRGAWGLWFLTKELLCILIALGIVVISATGVFYIYGWLWYWPLFCAVFFIGAIIVILCSPETLLDCVMAHQRGNIWNTCLRPYIFTLYNLMLYRHMQRASSLIQFSGMHKGSTHRAMATMYRHGKNVYHLTQNVDNLSLTAGMPMSRVLQIHGSAGRLMCTRCESSRLPAEGGAMHNGSNLSILRSNDSLPSLGHPWSWKCPICGSRRYMRPGVKFFDDRLYIKSYPDYSKYRRMVSMAFPRTRGKQGAARVLMPAEDTLYFIIGTTGRVDKTWERLANVARSTVIEINPEPACGAVAGYGHDYYAMRQPCDDVFAAWLEGVAVPLPDMITEEPDTLQPFPMTPSSKKMKDE